MTQPSLLDVPTPRRHRTTRQTSRASYAIGREQFTGRKADVLRWLSHYWNEWQVSPTSAELSVTRHWGKEEAWSGDRKLLYVRRGLSDLQTEGVVEAVPHGKRQCAVTGRTCETWRVSQR